MIIDEGGMVPDYLKPIILKFLSKIFLILFLILRFS